MRIYVHQIPVSNKKLRFSLEHAWVQRAFEELKEGIAKKAEGELILHRRDEFVQVRGTVEIVLERSCDICGEAIEFKVPPEFELNYEPSPDAEEQAQYSTKAGREEDQFLNEEELDIGW